MSATFTFKVNKVYTVNEGDRTNVVKKVDWTLRGEEAGQTFELPQSSDVPGPDGHEFVEFQNLTEAAVVTWLEQLENVDSIKAHIQYVLDKEVAKAALSTPDMPWAPPPAPAPEPAPAPAPEAPPPAPAP